MSSRELEIEITREIAPYAPEEQLGVYKATRWTWRQKQEAMMAAGDELDLRASMVKVDFIAFSVEMILACVVPPEGLEWNKEQVNALDPDVGDAVIDICRRVNETTMTERINFLEQSEPAENTPG